ncbi:MAG TPA: SPOR domain-containing protein [Burkholderiales bacterium]|nr:SPOR domain-containing protein [Burkholderiales bacterium]
MARAISDEELQLKRRARRRLIGAIVLVAAMVVVLPMVLDTEPRPVSQNITVRIPSPDANVFTPKAASSPVSKPATGKSAVSQVNGKSAAAPSGSQEAPKPAAQLEAAKPAKAEKPKAPARTATQAAKPAAPAESGPYVVQVIALADAEKARRMQQQIAAAGIKSYTEVVKTVKGDVTRVRAGPFGTREAAEKAREQLKSLGMNGNVTTR